MNFLDRLISASHNDSTLDAFLKKNINLVYDYFLVQDFTTLIGERSRIETYVSQQIKGLSLPGAPSDNNRLIFYNILLEVCERFGFLLPFNRLFQFLKKTVFKPGKRIEAASAYLVGIKKADDYISRFDGIFDNLEIAYQEEEDSIDKVLATICNYYLQVLNNFGAYYPSAIEAIKTKLSQKIRDDEFSFLNHPLIFDILQTDITDYKSAFLHIHSLLDSFLQRGKKKFLNGNKLLIEIGSEYSKALESSDKNFYSIRQIAASRFTLLSDKDRHFRSLQRGVKILSTEEEMLAYIYSYGPMHLQKLLSAFPYIPSDAFNQSLSITDWGCGQGIATVALLQFLKESGGLIDLDKVYLIEPSEIAISRAALHVINIVPEAHLITINKDLDSLEVDDFATGTSANLHLFSNILDIDEFSLTDLISLIKKTYKGRNYFVCASPYVTALKTSRIDSFIDEFSEFPAFRQHFKVNEQKGEWQNGWTRVVRVFEVEL